MKDLKIMQALIRHKNEIKKYNINETLWNIQKPIINSLNFTKKCIWNKF